VKLVTGAHAAANTLELWYPESVSFTHALVTTLRPTKGTRATWCNHCS